MKHPNEEGESYITVQLPIRLTQEEVSRLTEAASGGRQPPTSAEPCLVRARDRAEEALQLNRRRQAIVGGELFGDPAWNIMLDLFVRDTDGKKTSVSSACIGADVPSTTALRHLSHLVERRLVHRATCPIDQRKVYVRLTEEGRIRMVKLLG